MTPLPEDRPLETRALRLESPIQQLLKQIGVAVIGGSHASRKGYRPRSNREACRGRTEEIPSARR